MASIWVELLSSLLLFGLVFGMSATVEIAHIRKQVHNTAALLIGVSLQFVILPFVGFLTVQLFSLPAEVGITLLVITSSPGGSYSNWWCSMFNADLALSVTMTAVSTLLATLMLPANLILYTKFTYSAAVVQTLDWRALFVSIAVVIGGICSGLIASHRSHSTGNAVTMHRRANRLGNCAGLALIILSVSVSSSNQKAALWDQDVSFYAACAFPPILGLILAVTLASYFELEKPERVAVSIESCYQNTGIATTVALTMFRSEAELATAIGVPLLYGIVEGLVILTFCLICWKSGWTKAPANASLCTVIATSYEVENSVLKDHELTAIEVVLSPHDVGDKKDMIFSRTDFGSFVVDEETLEEMKMQSDTQKHAAILDAEDPTECSESDHVDENEELDGMTRSEHPVLNCRWRPYKALATPEREPQSSTIELGAIEKDELPVNSSRLDRSTVAGMRDRTKQYLSEIRAPEGRLRTLRNYAFPTQIPETHSDESNDQSQTPPVDQPSTAGFDVTTTNNATKSVVSKVAESVSKRRTRQVYKSVCTLSSPDGDNDTRGPYCEDDTNKGIPYEDCLL